MYEIWLIEEGGERILVRNDVTDEKHAKSLIDMANQGAEIRGEKRSYEAIYVSNQGAVAGAI